jgi:hypothetical protein
MIMYQKLICRPDLRANHDAIYLFGDNEERKGLGGQAREMRGEPNAIGIRTKKYPSNEEDSFWSDDHYDIYTRLIDEDLHEVFQSARVGHLIVIPLDGLGTGLSQLPTRAPKVFEYLNNQLRVIGNYC